MTDQDDDFWITHISTTPEEDADFAGCGGMMVWVILLGLLCAAMALWLVSG